AWSSAGGNHTCGSTNMGITYCWGSNHHGQLGDGTTIARTSPVRVLGVGAGSGGLTAGGTHTCSGLDDPEVDPFVGCWGSNANGQLHAGPAIDRPRRAPIFGARWRAGRSGFGAAREHGPF